tara:strand:- start:468 stop:1064 length:597 start_codon:yes stop_codon:yes gene_type:complete
MKIIFLGIDNKEDLVTWLNNIGEDVIYCNHKIDLDFVKMESPDYIISYNYHHILKKDIINYMGDKIINLHISYLPFNGGTYPNLWSFVEGTTSGVTIHNLVEEVDGGDILLQEKIIFGEYETLNSSYQKSHNLIKELFKQNWNDIKNQKIVSKKQNGKGTFHYDKDYRKYLEPIILDYGWDISIKDFKSKYREFNDIT